jgi:hypothetical protein
MNVPASQRLDLNQNASDAVIIPVARTNDVPSQRVPSVMTGLVAAPVVVEMAGTRPAMTV